ncbi:DUF5926 family protein [Corynebacterium nuruki]|uniref:Preprotein translocase subunit SecA n=1 Tax=Corynebacterium nuruki TaxID=1032851 RepID=A0A3D4SWH4_9CORY|nr:DUF5926 family protein [Corynebacterium nuruki]HCT13629.1 preprotein translocase subunit SecA [Corynebacterium nuruki]
MAKKNKKNDETLPEGMSRRQAKLARRAAERAALERDPRPYDGFAAEADLIALQEFVPAAYFDAELVPDAGFTRPVRIVTVLPGAVAALVRAEEEGGQALVALQTAQRGNNPNRDLAFALNWAKDAAPGTSLEVGIADGTEPALDSLLVKDRVPEIVVADDFNWWLTESQQADPTVQQSLQQANDSVLPSEKVDADITGSAWWIDPGEKAHIRWIRPETEEVLLPALARLHAAGELNLGEDTRFAGVFRTHGLLVPVFDLDNTVTAAEFAAPLQELDAKIAAALTELAGSGDAAQLSAAEQKSKQTIIAREVTIR